MNNAMKKNPNDIELPEDMVSDGVRGITLHIDEFTFNY
jgi:hypothetical protein